MKKILMAIAAVAMFCSCSKDDVTGNVVPMQESVVYISLNRENGTKATGEGHGVQADDNNIKTLEVFIFRINEGQPDDGVLDGYRKFTAAEIGNLTNLEVVTTTGRKIIYAVANSHRANWKDINTRALFEQQTALLQQDNVKDFIMTGSAEVELQLASTVAFTIRRMVSRINVASIKTSFAGTPYEGMVLEDVRVYLTNVQAEKLIFNGEGANRKVLDKNKYVAEDAQGCAMPGMIYDDLGTDIDDGGYASPHYFYCYENAFAEENDTDKFTRVIIEGRLNGTTYYYPIALEGVVRNCCYTVDVTIRRPGSLSPDSDVEIGTLLANVSVLDWSTIPGSTVEF